MDRLEEIQFRVEQASGSLEIIRYDHGGGRIGYFGDPNKGEKRDLVADLYNEADREFYFHARGDIMWLIAQLEASQQEAERLRAALERIADPTHPYSRPKMWQIARQALNEIASTEET
jgi:hypothetical protein